ncbi:hypothetical protein CSC94_08640 [Zhengella mangrovi]|uniref:Secretin/TonB short N-terminal domain-containing protein n=1 Tax=Zhengella mangrovi TaxID=1982044 RepID=A0A2G1QQI4_9HYPH|nr:secretin and TonB N-terminal domain-containing protein [Zhengella mangrovi]PHP67745.1 hypothetical protein CSC94_08640 [Zhengella mangrovi]
MSWRNLARAVVCIVLVAMAAQAAVARDREKVVNNVFLETDLRQALQDVAAQAEVNIIAEPGVQGVVSVQLTNASVESALRLLLAGTGYHFVRKQGYYLVFSADESSGDFYSVAQTRLVRLKHLEAETVMSLLPPTLQRFVRVDEKNDALAVTAPIVLMDRIVADVAKLDVPSGKRTVFVTLDNVRAATARSLLPEGLQRFVRPDTDRNTLAITAPQDTVSRILEQIAALDRPRSPGAFDVPAIYPTRLVKLNNITAKSAMALLPKSVQAYIQADEATNTLSVSAPGTVVGDVLASVSAVDVAQREVTLTARVVALDRANLLNLGGAWTFPKVTAGTVIGSAVKWPWQVSIGYTPDSTFTDALSLTLNLLTQNNEATIISSPQVMAQDGKEAEIRVTTSEYFPITTPQGIYVQSDLKEIETGTILGITPRIGRNGFLTLDMNIEVSDVIARGDKNYPVVSRRRAHSTVRIKDGGTAAIAGLVDTRMQLGKSGVPAMGELPLLGRAFRTDKLDHQARQVAIFVTATIVDPQSSIAKAGHGRLAPPAGIDKASYRDQLATALDRLKTVEGIE